MSNSPNEVQIESERRDKGESKIHRQKTRQHKTKLEIMTGQTRLAPYSSYQQESDMR